jgi:CRP/FNR family transcriptional regulator, anaerobic regulatory protein
MLATLSPALPVSSLTAADQMAKREYLEIETMGAQLQLARRRVQPKQALFRGGQPLHSLYLIHAGCFKTQLVSSDGREKITGFRMRGDLLGLDALGTPRYACDAVALELGEVWELPCAQLEAFGDRIPELRQHLTAALAREIRRDWHWMLSVGTLNAEQRVVAFLLDLAERQNALGFSPRHLMLRMTRADLGSFLSLTLETVTRVLSRLAGLGAIGVERRQIAIQQPALLRTLLDGGMAVCH